MIGDPQAESPSASTGDPVSNWQWLAHLMHRERLLVISDGDLPFARALGVGFTEQTIVPAELMRGIGRGEPLPFVTGTFDCVAVPDADAVFDLFGSTMEARGACAELRRVLRDHDGLYVGFERTGVADARRWSGRARRLSPSKQRRMLVRCGFRALRSYYVEPSPQRPYSIIPAATGAVVAWERLSAGGAWQSRARQMVARAGLHPLLFEHRVVIGGT